MNIPLGYFFIINQPLILHIILFSMTTKNKLRLTNILFKKLNSKLITITHILFFLVLAGKYVNEGVTGIKIQPTNL